MIAFFVLAAAAIQGSSQNEVSDTLEIPEAIAEPVSIYVACIDENVLTLSQRAGPVHWQVMQEIVARAERQCAEPRLKAYAEALRLIRRDKSIPAKDREGRVAQAFAAIDLSNAKLVADVRRLDEARQSQSKK